MRIDEVIQQPGQKERILKEDVLKSIHVAVPGEVVSYDGNKRTVVVQPVIRDWNSKDDPPLLLDVPVFFIGNYTFTPQKGDGCLVIFADYCIDAWLGKSGVNSQAVYRSHSMSDGFAFIGFNQTGGTPMGGGGSGGVPAIVRTYRVENVSGSYSHTFEEVAVTSSVKAILMEYSNPSAFRDSPYVDVGDQSVTITCSNVVGTSDVTITMIGGPDELSQNAYEMIMDRIGSLSVVNGKLCITYESE